MLNAFPFRCKKLRFVFKAQESTGQGVLCIIGQRTNPQKLLLLLCNCAAKAGNRSPIEFFRSLSCETIPSCAQNAIKIDPRTHCLAGHSLSAPYNAFSKFDLAPQNRL